MRRALFVLALFPSFALAGESLGTLTATIDGTEMTWFLTAEAGASQSAAAPVPGLTAIDISLWGNPEEGQLAELKGALLLDFMAMNAAGPQALQPEVQWLENGYAGAFVALEEGAASVTLTALEIGEASVTLSGTFEALAGFTDDVATMATDPARTKSIVGSFEASLPLN